MDNVEILLKIQALEIATESLKNKLKEHEESFKNELKEHEEKCQINTNDINHRVSKISNFLSFESLGKRVLLLGSLFGAIQILIQYISRLFK